MNGEFADQLLPRALVAGFTIEKSDLSRLEKYCELLRRWNTKLNLTSLPLAPLSDDAIDRLFIEPLAAARFLLSDGNPSRLPQDAFWLDLGSGGGSPAIPMKVTAAGWRLTMVESKSRKVAFLREVVRALALDGADAVDARFDQLGECNADVLTVRAVRLDAEFAESAKRLMKPSGVLAAFQTSEVALILPGFAPMSAESLVPPRPTRLHLYRRTT